MKGNYNVENLLENATKIGGTYIDLKRYIEINKATKKKIEEELRKVVKSNKWSVDLFDMNKDDIEKSKPINSVANFYDDALDGKIESFELIRKREKGGKIPFYLINDRYEEYADYKQVLKEFLKQDDAKFHESFGIESFYISKSRLFDGIKVYDKSFKPSYASRNNNNSVDIFKGDQDSMIEYIKDISGKDVMSRYIIPVMLNVFSVSNFLKMINFFKSNDNITKRILVSPDFRKNISFEQPMINGVEIDKKIEILLPNQITLKQLEETYLVWVKDWIDENAPMTIPPEDRIKERLVKALNMFKWKNKDAIEVLMDLTNIINRISKVATPSVYRHIFREFLLLAKSRLGEKGVTLLISDNLYAGSPLSECLLDNSVAIDKNKPIRLLIEELSNIISLKSFKELMSNKSMYFKLNGLEDSINDMAMFKENLSQEMEKSKEKDSDGGIGDMVDAVLDTFIKLVPNQVYFKRLDYVLREMVDLELGHRDWKISSVSSKKDTINFYSVESEIGSIGSNVQSQYKTLLEAEFSFKDTGDEYDNFESQPTNKVKISLILKHKLGNPLKWDFSFIIDVNGVNHISNRNKLTLNKAMIILISIIKNIIIPSKIELDQNNPMALLMDQMVLLIDNKSLIDEYDYFRFPSIQPTTFSVSKNILSIEKHIKQ
jgi:hypothetical protein